MQRKAYSRVLIYSMQMLWMEPPYRCGRLILLIVDRRRRLKRNGRTASTLAHVQQYHISDYVNIWVAFKTVIPQGVFATLIWSGKGGLHRALWSLHNCF